MSSSGKLRSGQGAGSELSDFRAAGPAAVKRELPAWSLSVLLHCILVLALGWMLHVEPEGAATEPNRSGGIVLAQRQANETSYFSEESPTDATDASAASEAAAESVQSALPEAAALPETLAGALPAADDALAELGGQVGDALPRAESMAQGGAPAKNYGGQTQTGVFGVSGVGSKFVYVFDRSGSMEGYRGRPLAAAKSELLASLQSLESVHQFQIIFYNERPTIFNPDGDSTPRLLFGDSRDKQLAERFVRGITPDGGTSHMAALKKALQMSPDVIFFLTDADEPQLRPAELREIARLNRRVAASINTIEFGSGGQRNSDNFLVRLARQNGGQHVYVDLTQLPRPR